MVSWEDENEEVISMKRFSGSKNVVWIIISQSWAGLLIVWPPFWGVSLIFTVDLWLFFRWKLQSELPKMPSQFGPQKAHWKNLRSWTNWQTWLNMTWKHLPKQSQRIRAKQLHLLELWTSLGQYTTSGSLPLPSFITRQSAPRWQAWAVCIIPHGRLWELLV